MSPAWVLLPPLLAAGASLLPVRDPFPRWISAAGGIGLLASGICLAHAVLGRGAPIPSAGEALLADPLGALWIPVAGLLGLSASMLPLPASARPIETRTRTALLQLLLLTLAMAAICNSVFLQLAATESAVLLGAALIAGNGHRRSVRAARGLAILGTAATGLALAGSFLLVISTRAAGGIEVLPWTALGMRAPYLDPGTLRIAHLLLLAGYGALAGLVPLGPWLAEAQARAPAAVSVLLSGGLWGLGLLGVWRSHAVLTVAGKAPFSAGALTALGLFAIGVGAIGMVGARDLRKMLAWSGTSHAGILALGLAAPVPLAAFGAALHLASHALAKGMAILASAELVERFATHRMERIRGALRASPAGGSGMVAAGIALAGLPPSGLFVSLIAILAGTASAGGWATASLALAGSLLIFATLALRIGGMTLGIPPARLREAGGAALAWIPVLLLGASVVLLGLTPFGSLRELLLRAGAGALGGVP